MADQAVQPARPERHGSDGQGRRAKRARRAKPRWLLPFAAALSACSAGSHFETDAATFVGLATRPAASLSCYTFVGAAGGRAYLSAWSGRPWWFGGGEDIYSVALDELPSELADQIRAGLDPWARSVAAGDPQHATKCVRDCNAERPPAR